MSIDPDNIYKALRPVPEFDGNPNVLTRFIQICDQIVTQYMKNEPAYQLSNLCLINGILNKITGPAARTINANGIPENWLGIKNALINNFADQRDETALYNDLSLATQGNDSPQEFYDRCQTLFSTIMTYVSLHETVKTTIEAKRDLYRKLAKQAFVRGLKEPLGSRIRCMRPETIEKALEFVQEEINVMYLQQRNDSVPERRNTSAHASTPYKVPSLGFNVNTPKMFSAPSPSSAWPKPPLAFAPPYMPQQAPQWRPNAQVSQPQQRMPSYPTRTQQIFRAPPPNYNPNNNFKLPPPRNVPPHNSGPKPMSGVSHYVPKVLPPSLMGRDWRVHGNPPPSNYFKSREMNFNEFADYNDYYDNYYGDYYYEPYRYPYSEHYYDINSEYEYAIEQSQHDHTNANNVTDGEVQGPVDNEQDFSKGRPKKEQG